MEKYSKYFWYLLLAFIIIGAVIYFFAPLDFKEKKEKFIVGVNIPQTGNLATIGEQIKSGMDLAIEEIQDTTFVIKYQDNKGNAKDGLNATNFILENIKPNAMIVNLTSVAMSSKPILKQSNFPCIYLSTHPLIIDGCTNCFRLFTSGVQEGDMIVNEINSLKLSKIGLIYVKDAYGEGTINYIKNKLISLNKSIEFEDLNYPLSDFDFKEILTKAKNKKINNLIVIGYGFEYPTLFAKLKELNYAPSIFSNFSFSNKKGKEISDYKGKIIFSAPIFDINEKRSSEMNSFVEKYKAKYYSEPDFNAAYGYDNIKILYLFYKSKKQDLRLFLKNYNYSGAMGKYTFLENGDVNLQLELIRK